ncbi:hypothetical protein OPKNFCMD_6309 [Methylobacterium crusticola]|uniref:ABM domain-containing protein n=1 Tax=Methylobacterium crusticola TaxID=1697972 RepID=A0ABQ4R742_9HYPH|nr:antibiotic biosynthesis monooxygenase family protein [Methylobacterium crusticola]GJD53532.1 hypothetical protein OPKNFCMD_6309 [Methylobacterium crusticola]
MSQVVLINPFEVRPGDEAAALAYWDRAAAHLRGAPGFVSTTLHRALRPDARFPLVNVAAWASAEAFQAAVGSPAFRALTGDEAARFPHHPALYAIVRT